MPLKRNAPAEPEGVVKAGSASELDEMVHTPACDCITEESFGGTWD